MTIKSNGGIFARNPTFNNVTVDGTLTVDQVVGKNSANGTTFNGVTLKDGNVVVASGKGIDFSATSGVGTSELLNDYEEGTWTPVLTGSTSGTSTMSGGYYTKIGNIVTIRVVTQTALAVGALVGALSITGLPYAANSFSNTAYFCQSNSLLHIRSATVTGTTGAPFAVIYLSSIKLHTSANLGASAVVGNAAATFLATSIPQTGSAAIIIDWVFTYTVA